MMRATLCVWITGLMVASVPGCGPSVGDDDHVRRCAKPSRTCTVSGRCDPGTELDACVIGEDADCAKAQVCGRFGRCAKGSVEDSSALQCVKFPKAAGFDVSAQLTGDQACANTLKEYAYCRAGTQRCRAQRPEDDAGPHSVCVPGTDADCAASEVCAAYGRCSKGINACVTASKADCAKSKICKEDGACSPRTVDGVTFCAVNTDADCANTPACKTKGACLADPTERHGHRCVDAETLAERKAMAVKAKQWRAERERESKENMKAAAERKAKGLPPLGGGGVAGAQTCEACKKRCQATTNVAEQKETDDAFDQGKAGVVDLFAETVYLEYNKLAVCDKTCAHLCK